jgi:hypothetical protein
MVMLCMSTSEGTEPCLNNTSRLHRLACGHVVYTELSTTCGSNCSTPICDFAPFICTICEHWKMVLEGTVKRKSSRSTDLILPNYHPVDQSHVPIMLRTRETNIVVMVSGEKVFIPYTTKDIAFVRVHDQQRLDRILDRLTEVATTMSCPDRVVETVTEGLLTCVNHQHVWVTATYRERAACVLYVPAVHTDMYQIHELDFLDELCAHLSSSVEKVEPLLPEVTKLLVDLDAHAALATFVHYSEHAYPTLWRQRKKFGSLVLKLWYRV